MSFQVKVVSPNSPHYIDSHYIDNLPESGSTSDSCCTKICSFISKIFSDYFKKQDSALRSFYQSRDEYNIELSVGSDSSGDSEDPEESMPLKSSNNSTSYGTSLSTPVTLSSSHIADDDDIAALKELNALLSMKWLTNK